MSSSDSDRPVSPRDPRAYGTLCASCAHVKRIESAKGSTFFLCTRSKADERFPKYPPQPVRACTGYERSADF
jgi:hypothetical protein